MKRHILTIAATLAIAAVWLAIAAHITQGMRTIDACDGLPPLYGSDC